MKKTIGKRRAQIVVQVKAEEEPSAPSSRKPSFAVARRAERNRRAKASWKQRQREALEFFSQQRKEELQHPFPVYTADSGRLTRRVYSMRIQERTKSWSSRTLTRETTSGRRRCFEVSQAFHRSPPQRSSVGTVGVEGILFPSAPKWKGGSASQRM